MTYRLIIVTGMHRSGTSLLAGLLAQNGGWAGPADSLLPADAGNEQGYHENRDVLDLNEHILASLGRSWTDPPTADEIRGITERFRRSTADLMLRLRQSRPSHHHPLVIKDPRLLVLSDVWSPWIRDAVVLVAQREPVEVARSLLDRDGIPLDVGLALWEVYVSRSLDLAARMPGRVQFVEYEELLSMGEAANAWAAAIVDNGPPAFDGAVFPDTSLRHHSVGGPLLGWLTDSQMALRSAIRDRAGGRNLPTGQTWPSDGALHRLCEWRAHQRLLFELESHQREMARLRHDVAKLQSDCVARTDVERWQGLAQQREEALSEGLTAATQRRRDLEEEIARISRDAAAQQAELVSLQAVTSELRAQLQDSTDEAEQQRYRLEVALSQARRLAKHDLLRFTARVSELEAALAEKEDQLARQRGSTVKLQESLAEARADEQLGEARRLWAEQTSRDLQDQLANARDLLREQALFLMAIEREKEDFENTLRQIYASRSWRWTAPMRRHKATGEAEQ